MLANNLWAAGYALDPIDEGVVWNYRLTRALVAACGAGLASSGMILQSLLRNPLPPPTYSEFCRRLTAYKVFQVLTHVALDTRGWRLTPFNDYDTQRYCDCYCSPDGRVGTLEDASRNPGLSDPRSEHLPACC
ncbi:hypothetical protein PS900_03421 [Pseudomonas fluorescens]|uniref:Uncharacterized protein n=1 Tax=Pseudomonas fluorescens TaxID=294 RepID=A0A8H2RR13_PSEFL|nr:hypothetical protein PS900_03421 [Pseudomonas fluorescens]